MLTSSFVEGTSKTVTEFANWSGDGVPIPTSQLGLKQSVLSRTKLYTRQGRQHTGLCFPATMHNRGIKGIQGQRLLVNAPNFAVHFSTIKQQLGAIFSTLIRQEEPMSTVMTLDLHLV
jgi:hypothetical protein